MAIGQGAGTEIIRSHMYENLNGTQTLIIGEPHHIYSVLSVIIHAVSLAATTDYAFLQIVGWDAHDGTSGATQRIFKQNIPANSTFVWNDKFTFNGTEPTGISGASGSVAHQTAIAAQETGGTAQYLQFDMSSTSDDFDVFVTFIDQNNS